MNKVLIDVKKLISSSLTEFLAKKQNTSLFMFVSKEDMEIIPQTADNCKVYDMTDPSLVNQPYSPFMPMLRQYDLTDDEIRKHTFDLQYNRFLQYIKTDSLQFERLYSSLRYEQYQCFSTIISLLKLKEKETIVIKNAQLMVHAVYQLLSMIEEISEKEKYVPFQIILCFDKDDLLAGRPDKELFHEIQENFCSFDFTGMYSDSFTSTYSLEYPLNINSQDFLNCYLFHDIETGCRLFEAIEKQKDLAPIPDTDRRKIYLLAGFFYKDEKNIDKAIKCLYSVISDKQKDQIYAEALLQLAHLYHELNSDKEALNLCSKIIKYYPETDTACCAKGIQWICLYNRYNLAHLTTYLADQKEKILEEFNSICREMQEHGLTYLSLKFQQEEWRTLAMIFQRILDLKSEQQLLIHAKKLEEYNYYDLLVWDYNCLATMNSNAGNYDKAFEFYKKSQKIVADMNDTQNLICSENGISYINLQKTDFVGAYRILNHTFRIKNNSRSMSNEIMNIMYNMSRALFYTRNFKDSAALLHMLINSIHALNIQNLEFQTYEDMCMQLAIMDFISGKYSKARTSLYLLENNSCRKTSFIKQHIVLLEMLFAIHDGDFQKAEILFSIAKQNYIKNWQGEIHNLCFFYFEYSTTLQKFGNEKKAEIIWQEAADFAKEHNFTYFKTIAEEYNPASYSGYSYPLEPIKVNFNEFIEAVHHTSLLNEIRYHKLNLKFIQKITKINFEENDAKQYLDKITQEVFDFIIGNKVTIAEKPGEEWQYIAAAGRSKDMRLNQKQWNEAYNQVPSKNKYAFIRISDKILYRTVFIKPDTDTPVGILLETSLSAGIPEDVKTILDLAFFNIATKLKYILKDYNESEES